MAIYELIDKHGTPTPRQSDSVQDLAAIAASLWPSEHQDNSGDYEEPNGWDIRPVGTT